MRRLLPVLILVLAAAGFLALRATRPAPPAVETRERVWRIEAEPLAAIAVNPTLVLYGRIEAPDRVRAAAILASDDYGEMVRVEEAYWADQNVTGVPAFILGGRMMVPGAQDPEVFIRVIENKVLAAAA